MRSVPVEGVSGGLFPEGWFDAEFVHGLNETAEVMSKDFAKGFVYLRRARLASETVAKLGLNHMEGCFDV